MSAQLATILTCRNCGTEAIFTGTSQGVRADAEDQGWTVDHDGLHLAPSRQEHVCPGCNEAARNRANRKLGQGW
jgi:ribosomal protein L37AE/L43A